MHYQYKTRGTCSQRIDFDYENGKVYNVTFLGGCRGNTQGVARLSEGRDAAEIVACCEGILCREGTSCPDQLAQALRQVMAENPPVNKTLETEVVEGSDPDCANCPTPCGREKLI